MNYSVNDPDNAFSVDASECEMELEDNEACNMEVTFEPTVHGTFNGTVSVTLDDGRNLQISMTGGTGSPEATISPADEWDFGPATAGSIAAARDKELHRDLHRHPARQHRRECRVPG